MLLLVGNKGEADCAGADGWHMEWRKNKVAYAWMSSWVSARLTSSWEPMWLWHSTTCQSGAMSVHADPGSASSADTGRIRTERKESLYARVHHGRDAWVHLS
jgi:hypothetical protein